MKNWQVRKDEGSSARHGQWSVIRPTSEHDPFNKPRLTAGLPFQDKRPHGRTGSEGVALGYDGSGLRPESLATLLTSERRHNGNMVAVRGTASRERLLNGRTGSEGVALGYDSSGLRPESLATLEASERRHNGNMVAVRGTASRERLLKWRGRTFTGIKLGVACGRFGRCGWDCASAHLTHGIRRRCVASTSGTAASGKLASEAKITRAKSQGQIPNQLEATTWQAFSCSVLSGNEIAAFEPGFHFSVCSELSPRRSRRWVVSGIRCIRYRRWRGGL
jgi:hypothetical protein